MRSVAVFKSQKQPKAEYFNLEKVSCLDAVAKKKMAKIDGISG